MAQDIRDMMKGESFEGPKLSKGHESRFEARLHEAFPKKKKTQSFLWLKIAAAVIAFVALGFWYFNTDSKTTVIDTFVDAEGVEDLQTPQLTMGDISPDLKKIEEFYLAGIQVQLASLEKTDDNKELIEGYLKRLAELDKEYQRLTNELNEVGPTEATINALIDNLKLRLELLFKLKNKLKELKQLENEQFSESIG